MSISMYDLSVATYQQILGGVSNALDKGAEYAATGDMDLDELVQYRLRDDMAPFTFQVISVWHHSINAIKGLKAGEFNPPPKMGEMDYAACQSLVAEAITELGALSRDEVDALAGNPMLFKMGSFEIPFTSENFVLSFSLPNFYFHATTTYSILRANGVPLGKMDFLGQMRVTGS